MGGKKKSKKAEEVKVEETKNAEEIQMKEIVEVKTEVVEELKVEEFKPVPQTEEEVVVEAKESNVIPFKRVSISALEEKAAKVKKLKEELEAAEKEEKEIREKEMAEKAPIIERLQKKLETSTHDVEVAKNLVRIATDSLNEIKSQIEAVTGKPIAKRKKLKIVG
jgi:hypothetical protein